MPDSVIDGWVRLNDGQKLDKATEIAYAAITRALGELDPEARDAIYAEFRAMSRDDRRDLIKRVLAEEGIGLDSMANVKLDDDALQGRLQDSLSRQLRDTRHA
jgi:hypothetical protein